MSIFGAAAKAPEVKDVEIPNVQADSISSIAFAPNADFLAVASWSNEVRIFQVGPGGQSEGKAQYTHEGPVLCVDWSKDGTKVISGGTDKAGRIYDVATSQSSQFAAHEAPIKCAKYAEINGQGVVATASWDKTLKYWDLRTPTAIASVALPERAYTMDVAGSLMIVGTAERHVNVFNLSAPLSYNNLFCVRSLHLKRSSLPGNPQVIFKTVPSPLRYQTRAIACIPDGTGYAIGSIEGRVAIQHIDESKVNCLSFHPLGSLATGGGDGNGTVNIWDHYSRTRLKTFSDVGGNVADTSFSHTGQYLAYAVSYDWSKGHGGALPNLPNKVMIHTCIEEEVRRRNKK
ncbi:mRNA export factor, partial [Phenoliferia sp. Uapishka_3]